MLKTIKIPLIYFMTWKSLILLYQIFIQDLIKKTHWADSIEKKLITSWATHWDAERYTSIVVNGYEYPNHTFFPLNPLLVYITSHIMPIHYASMVISHGFAIIATILLYKLTELKFNTQVAQKTTRIFLAFPGTFFMLANYSEAPTLALILISFILYEKKRYLLSALTAGVASAGRLASLALTTLYLFVPLKKTYRIILGLLSISGFLAYLTYLQITHNDFLLFLKAQQEWCKIDPCSLTFPLFTPIIFFVKFLQGTRPATELVDIVTSFLFLSLTAIVYKKLGKNYALFSLFTLILWLTNGKIISMTRYALLAFPVFMVLGTLIKSNKLLSIVLTICFIIQLIFITLFTNFIFVG